MIVHALLLLYVPFTFATLFQFFYPMSAPTLTNLSENVYNETLALVEGISYTPDKAVSIANDKCLLWA